MAFIILLMITATAIAGAAAYFSVYGLAYTFSGVFWSVVVMGASLEAGKLVAASYLYRYWTRTGWILKTYLITGVVALMVLTSTGIFGYLSTGYQQDILPLKQKTEQVRVLEEEKERVLARKRQIDDLMASNSTATNVNSAKGGLDTNAARVLRETTRNRDSLVKQYKAEQEQVTKRVAELDQQLLTLKQELIKQEAHIGPIMFVAQAFDLPTDDATKYLIFLIIFAFDPMAVALTLAVNIALRLHKEDQTNEKSEPTHVAFTMPVELPVAEKVQELPADLLDRPGDLMVDKLPVEADVVDESQLALDLQPVVGERTHPEIIHEEADEPPEEMMIEEQETVVEPLPEPEPEAEAQPVVEPVKQVETSRAPVGLSRQFAGMWGDPPMSKINELVSHLRYLKERQAQGLDLTESETWELRTIEDILRKNGYDKYM